MKDFKETTNADSFIKVEKWMVFDLGLSGIDLLLYGMIYSYTLSCGGFTGSRAHLIFWLGCSLSTLDRHVNDLIEKGYLKKTQWMKNGEMTVCLTAAEETYNKAKAAAAARRAALENRPQVDGTTPESGQGVTHDGCAPDSSWVRGTPIMTHNTDRDTNSYTDSENARTRAERAGKKKASGERETKQTMFSSFDTDDFFLAALRKNFGDDATY